MTKFFKLLFIGVKDALEELFIILILLLPFIVAATLSIATGLILKQFIGPEAAIVVAVIAGVFGYWLTDVVAHCIDAMRYIKETGTDSLKDAWRNTVPSYWP